MSKIKDMTEGRPFGLMIRFAVPLMLVGILQLVYTMVDSATVGQVMGVDAFASVAVTGNAFWLVMSSVLGITQGFGTVFAQRFGAKDTDGLRRAFATGVLLSVILGAVISCAGIFGSRYALEALNTSENLIDGATVYLGILLGGMPITLMYNTLGAMLRALGNSKTPLYAMIASTVFNIGMDIALVFPLGIAGVAIATLMAQVLACVICVRSLRRVREAHFSRRDFSVSSAGALLRLSLPLGLRNAVIQVGGLAVQYYINGYGEIYAAGVGAAKNMYNLLLIAAGGVDGAVATFVAQNFGAGLLKRVRRGVRTGLWMMLISSVVMAAAAVLFGRFLMGLQISGDPTRLDAVLDVGQQQLNTLAFGLPVLCLLFLYRSALQGVGNALFPMLSGFLELAGRFAAVLGLTAVWGVWGVYLADPAGWVLATVLLAVSYAVVFRRKLRAGEEDLGNK